MITSSSRIQINSDIDDTTLIISSVTVGDAGTYECRAENMAGTASREYSVSVGECVPLCTVSKHTSCTENTRVMLMSLHIATISIKASAAKVFISYETDD